MWVSFPGTREPISDLPQNERKNMSRYSSVSKSAQKQIVKWVSGNGTRNWHPYPRGDKRLTKVLSNIVFMGMNYKHVFIIDKKISPFCWSCNRDIQFFFGKMTFGSPCIIFNNDWWEYRRAWPRFFSPDNFFFNGPGPDDTPTDEHLTLTLVLIYREGEVEDKDDGLNCCITVWDMVPIILLYWLPTPILFSARSELFQTSFASNLKVS